MFHVILFPDDTKICFFTWHFFSPDIFVKENMWQFDNYKKEKKYKLFHRSTDLFENCTPLPPKVCMLL